MKSPQIRNGSKPQLYAYCKLYSKVCNEKYMKSSSNCMSVPTVRSNKYIGKQRARTLPAPMRGAEGTRSGARTCTRMWRTHPPEFVSRNSRTSVGAAGRRWDCRRACTQQQIIICGITAVGIRRSAVGKSAVGESAVGESAQASKHKWKSSGLVTLTHLLVEVGDHIPLRLHLRVVGLLRSLELARLVVDLIDERRRE